MLSNNNNNSENEIIELVGGGIVLPTTHMNKWNYKKMIFPETLQDWATYTIQFFQKHNLRLIVCDLKVCVFQTLNTEILIIVWKRFKKTSQREV